MDINHDTGSIEVIQILDTTVLPPLGGTVGVLTINGTGALILPNGSTAQQPTGAAGMIRFNNTASIFEGHTGSAWVDLGKVGTVTSVAVSGSTGLTVGSSPITTSGTITLTLGVELQGLSGLAANGIITRTAAGTYSARTITGTAGNVVITNGDGVAGAPTINLATLGTPVTTSFVKITTDTFGRVSGTTAVTTADITTALGYTPVNKAGDTITGTITMSGATITGVPTPVAGTDVANKNYVDSAITGLDFKQNARLGTVTTLPTYTAAGSQVGKTLTGTANGALSIDGIAVVVGNRILVKNESTGVNNGIYTVTQTGGAAAPYILTRATDSDQNTKMNASEFIFVAEGNTIADTGWVLATNDTINVDTTSLSYVQFTGSGLYTAGAGLTLTGNQFALTNPVTTALGGTGLATIGTANQVLGTNAGATGLEYKTITAGTNITITNTAGAITINGSAGGVTSVGLAAPSIFTVTNSPVTATGTLTLALATQAVNTVFAGPSSGGAAAPTFRVLAYADLPIKLYAESVSTPAVPVATGTNTIAIGSGSNATTWGSTVFANDRFATSGDSQTGLYTLRGITTTATPTELFLDAANSQRLVLPNNSLFTFVIYVAARRTDATGGGAGYKFEGAVRKDATAGSLTLIGTPSKTILGETNAAWNITLVANTTTGALTLTAVGEAAKTIRWTATVITTEVTN
jgi:hypothetical protein